MEEASSAQLVRLQASGRKITVKRALGHEFKPTSKAMSYHAVHDVYRLIALRYSRSI
jgi:hypothetical protein